MNGPLKYHPSSLESRFLRDDSYATNTISVETAVNIANKINIPLLYISTAGIFDGKKEFYDDYGYPVAEGTEVTLFVKRDDAMIELPYSMEHKARKYKHRLRLLKEPTKIQSQYYSIWLGQ